MALNRLSLIFPLLCTESHEREEEELVEEASDSKDEYHKIDVLWYESRVTHRLEPQICCVCQEGKANELIYVGDPLVLVDQAHENHDEEHINELNDKSEVKGLETEHFLEQGLLVCRIAIHYEIV